MPVVLVAPVTDALDQVAGVVFGGAKGQQRLDPLIARFVEEVGPLRPDDPDFEVLQAERIDWALCEAQLDGPGDTWAWRASQGAIPGLDCDPVLARQVAFTVAGLFEVWPGEVTWLRDRVAGLCLALLDSPGPLPPARRGPAALWGARVAFGPDRRGVHLGRSPLEYPLELLATLEGAHARHFEDPAWPSMQQLRRARADWARTKWRHARPGLRSRS